MLRVTKWPEVEQVDQNHGELTGTLSHAPGSLDWTDEAATDAQL